LLELAVLHTDKRELVVVDKDVAPRFARVGELAFHLEADGFQDLTLDIPDGQFLVDEKGAHRRSVYVLTRKSTPQSFFGTNQSANDPVVADVLGTGTPEILVPTNTEVAVFSSTGTQLTWDHTPPQGAKLTFYTQTSLSNVEVVSLKISPTANGTGVILSGVVPNDDVAEKVRAAAQRFASDKDTVIKYGVDIGKVVKPIRTGEHAHVHNIKTKRW
jgi:hypothetical protein